MTSARHRWPGTFRGLRPESLVRADRASGARVDDLWHLTASALMHAEQSVSDICMKIHELTDGSAGPAALHVPSTHVPLH
jgi:hypothetical protein